VLKSGKSIVIDNTHLRLKYIRPYFEKFTDRADIKINIFDISIEDAIERDINRGEKKVGKDVIERMYGNYLNLLPILEKEYKEYII